MYLIVSLSFLMYVYICKFQKCKGRKFIQQNDALIYSVTNIIQNKLNYKYTNK